MTIKAPTEYLSKPVNVLVAGCGGTGSQIITGIARLHVSLVELGHPGLNVVVADPDTVTEFNVGRQLFAPADIGLPKAECLVNRVNAYYGLDFKAHFGTAGHYMNRVASHFWNCDILIGCVDTRKARQGFIGMSDWWLDIGNTARQAQVIFGQQKIPGKGEQGMRLPNVAELFPEIVNPKNDKDSEPSCSMAGALEKQDLFVNQAAATFALNLLWAWFRRGIDYHGAFINLDTCRVTPLPIDMDHWRRLGYDPSPAPLQKIKKYIRKPNVFRSGLAVLECGHEVLTSAHKRARCPECRANKERTEETNGKETQRNPEGNELGRGGAVHVGGANRRGRGTGETGGGTNRRRQGTQRVVTA